MASGGLVTITIPRDAPPPFATYTATSRSVLLYTDLLHHHLLDLKQPPYIIAPLPREFCRAVIWVGGKEHRSRFPSFVVWIINPVTTSP